MNTSTASARDYSVLVQHDRVHGSVYTDATVFNDEMERIFHSGWVYIGHDSEVNQPGAFCVKPIGRQSVIMTRDKAGQVHVMYDRCPHRGNKICQTEKGVGNALTCPYHGWTFAMDGQLTGLPAPRGFGPDFDRSQAGMAHLPRVESYGGFVFGSMAPDGISLEQHLGKAREMIDQLLEMSPSRKIRLSAGWIRQRFHGNWKNVVENQVDGYHAPFVHSSLMSANRDWAAERDRRDTSDATARDLGMGHSDIDHSVSYRAKGGILRWTGLIPEERAPEYVAAMRAAYGEEGAQSRLVVGPPHAMIFPNLFIAEMNIMVVQPVAPGETVHWTTPVILEDGGEINERSLRRCEGALGPAGFLIADDAEISELNQIGLNNREPEWVLLRRGLHDELHQDDGTIVGGLMDETSQRAFWRRYHQVMEGTN
jgi:phenylpropionate dioxygenase-like ring-hydroxylating dioxygenase large terminal subunit